MPKGKGEGERASYLLHDGAGVQAGGGDDAAAEARVDQLVQPLRGHAAVPAATANSLPPSGLAACRTS